MKILFYGDLQINHKYSTYMQFLDLTLRGLIQVIDKYRPDLVINLGDTMDTKETVKVDDLIWAWNKIRAIEEQCSPPSIDGYAAHWIIKGNHDIADKNGERASIQVFEGMNTQVFMDPDVIQTSVGDFLILPYTEDYDKLFTILQEFDLSKVVAIAGHVEWKGCRLTPSFVSKEGLHPIEFLKRFSPAVRAFNGHYHHPVDLGRLCVVGSPLHKDFNDVIGPIDRGFTWWDTDSDTVTRIANPCTYYCVALTLRTEEEIKEIADRLQANKNLRMKITVPSSLIDETKEAFEDFLWVSVIPVAERACSLYDGSGLKIASSSAEIINRGVEAAPDTFNEELLRTQGKELF